MKLSKLFKVIFPHTVLSFLTAKSPIDLAGRLIKRRYDAKQSISFIYQRRPLADWTKHETSADYP